jgi:hypothetical protein
MSPFARPIDADGVDGIARLADPVQRNLWITVAYHDLNAGVGELLGSGNLSWPGFATWASKTAGRSIRGEDLPAQLRAALDASVTFAQAARQLDSLVKGLGGQVDTCIAMAIKNAVAAVSRHIAAGNLEVFEELGPLHAAMLARFRGGAAPEEVAAFVASVTAVDGKPEATERLRAAVGHCLAAMAEPDPGRRAQRILLANMLIGLTEQIRLQPRILGALNAPLAETLRDWLDALLRSTHVIPPVRVAIEEAFAVFVAEAQGPFRRALAQHVMTLQTPSGVLRLGEDVPFAPGTHGFPADLERIDDPALAALLNDLDRTGGTARGSGARDWAILGDRMNYIVNLFRARQQERALESSPFTAEQIAVLHAGGLPLGPL